MFPDRKNDKIVAADDTCRWVAERLADVPRMGEREWTEVHEKVKKISRDLSKMLSVATHEEEKIALLQAGHDALYLLSGYVTHTEEQHYLDVALPVVVSYLDNHENEPVDACHPSYLRFLKYALDLLYSSRFLAAADTPGLADRLADYTSRRLDALRECTTHPSPELQELLSQEETLYAEA